MSKKFIKKIMKKRRRVRDFVTLAVMTALAVAARAIFVMVPHFKPMSGVIMISGMAFGSGAGFIVGAASAFFSNFLFGQGAWTPWQMLAYGVAGVFGGFLKGKDFSGIWRLLLVAVYGFMVILVVVGPILDTSSLFLMSDANRSSNLAAVYLSGLPLNAVHGTATFFTLLLLCRPMLDKLNRIKVKYGIWQEEKI